MKKITQVVLLLMLTGINQVAIGQTSGWFGKTVLQNQLNLRGPVPPTNLEYGKYKSYEMILDLAPGLESSMNNRKIPYSAEKYYEAFSISGLKKQKEGDFKVKYNLTRFELVNDEDYVQNTYQKAPAYYIGLESNLEITKSDLEPEAANASVK